VDDALFALRAAMAEGTVVGGGAALAHIARTFESLQDRHSSFEWRTALDIMRHACLAPIRRLAKNAGMDSGYVESNLPEDITLGWDAMEREFTDLREAGIIDPVKVTKVALKNGVICASLILQTDTFICEVQDEKESSRSLIVKN